MSTCLDKKEDPKHLDEVEQPEDGWMKSLNLIRKQLERLGRKLDGHLPRTAVGA